VTRGAYRALLALVVLALVAPIWLAPIPPLSDYVNHVARAHVLAHYGESAAYQAAYAPAWGPYPNLAFDLFAVPLSGVLDALIVGKLFLTLTVAVWCAGCVALGRAVTCGDSLRALVACFFVTCEPFLLGYANFTFGTGLALLAIAASIRAREQRGWAALVLPATLSLAVAVSHAAAIVTLGLVGTGFAIARLASREGASKAARELLAFAPGGIYFVVWLATQADHGKDRDWSSIGTSLRTLATSILPSYVPSIDLAILGGLAVAAAAACVLARPVRLERAVAAAAALCAVAVFVAPSDFAGSYEANGRYALGAWTLGLFALRSPEKIDRRLLATAGVAFAILFGRQALVGRAWMTLGRELAEERALLAKVPERATVANVTFLDGRAPRSARLRELALLHAPALAAMDREATVPTLYAIPGVQPLAHQRALYDVHRFKAGDAAAPDVARLAAEMDAVWLCRAPEELVTKLEATFSPAGAVGDCSLMVRELR
jgi:hypothetical protein